MATALMGLSFGKRKFEYQEISANLVVATYSRKLLFEKRLDAIVADRSIPLAEDECNFIGSSEAEVHDSTLKLAFEFAGLAKVNAWGKVIIVTAPDYLKRAKRDVQFALAKLGVQCEVIGYEMNFLPNNVWYDSRRNSQLWTKWRWLYLFYDFILMQTPMWLYEKMTTQVCAKGRSRHEDC